MVDYAEAMAAIEAKLAAEWTATPIGYANPTPAETPEPWPPIDDVGNPAPFVVIEVKSTDANIVGTGTPGNQTICDDGMIVVSALVPSNTGRALARQNAVAIGEIYRNKKFYDATPGAYIRSWTPKVGEGAPAAIEGAVSGNYYCVSVTIPFEFWHRG